MLGLSVCDWAG